MRAGGTVQCGALGPGKRGSAVNVAEVTMPPRISRRRLLQSLPFIVTTGCTRDSRAPNADDEGSFSALGLDDQTENVEIVRQQIPLPPRFNSLRGLRICFLTDLHLGVTLSPEYLEKVFQTAESLSPHLITLGGDYVYAPESSFSALFKARRNPDFKYGEHPPEVAQRVFDTIAHRAGQLSVPVVAVLGNHDNWCHPSACIAAFKRSRIRCLVNESAECSYKGNRYTVIGVDDYLTGRPRIPEKSVNSNSYTILLSHNPDFVSSLTKRESPLPFNLALCGHTHGGQIAFPPFGFKVYHVRDWRFAEGLRQVDSSHVYTSRGLGVVEIPYRIGVRPEITLLTLA